MLRFDFTGLGQSEGEFANTNFASNVEDLVAAADFLRGHYRAPKILVGHSLGGAAVLAAAAEVPEAVCVATVGAPAKPSQITRHVRDHVEEIETRGEAEVEIAGRPFRVTRKFLDFVGHEKHLERIGELDRALIVFHSPVDEVVGIDNARLIYQAARHPKSFVSLDAADHLLSRNEDAEYVGAVLAAWATRYLGAIPPGESGAHVAEGDVVVAEASHGGRFTQEIQAGPHHLHADEPERFGGADLGPSPYDLLSAALGSCTAMTIRVYADRKQIPLEKVSVTLRHAKIHAEDCADCETPAGKIDRIEREIRLQGPKLTGEQRKRLVEIADRCPVHRTLHSEVKVRTREVGD